jgi:hypothetical protein
MGKCGLKFSILLSFLLVYFGLSVREKHLGYKNTFFPKGSYSNKKKYSKQIIFSLQFFVLILFQAYRKVASNLRVDSSYSLPSLTISSMSATCCHSLSVFLTLSFSELRNIKMQALCPFTSKYSGMYFLTRSLSHITTT